MKNADYNKLKVTVMGLGLFGGGVGAASYFARHGATVTVTDLKTEDHLAESVKLLDGLDIEFHLGEHRETDFTQAGLLVVSPAVNKNTSPYVKLARDHGVKITSEMNVFLSLCDACICGITGSVGKSTTTAMIHHVMSRTHAYRKVFLGGNIGQSLLDEVDDMCPRDLVVLELSSFMLEDADALGVSPHVALVTNIVPNHLDRHIDMAGYVRAKQTIARYQSPDDVLVLNASVQKQSPWEGVGSARRVVYSLDDGYPEVLDHLRIPGRHNRENGLAAFSACLALGAADYEIGPQLKTFRGLPDRIELVRTVGNVQWYNDSKATTPDAAVTAIDTFPESSLVLIAGGSPKDVSYMQMAQRIIDRVRLCIVIGRTGPEIARCVRELPGGDRPEIQHVESLERAVSLAHAQARPDEVVLLSPGCASYDMFDNYVERGKQFTRLVRSL